MAKGGGLDTCKCQFLITALRKDTIITTLLHFCIGLVYVQSRLLVARSL
jgi:hypothetical protein